MPKEKRIELWQLLGGATIAAILIVGTPVWAGDGPAKPVFEEDGTVRVPAFELPPSKLSSPEARAAQAMRAKRPAGAPPADADADADIASVRAGLEAMLAPQVAQMREVYTVDISDRTIAGVPTRVVKPKGKPYDRERVLINLHGGGFSMCAGACGLLESVPIAALGGYEVITVAYRQGPEAKHPAAVEDVAAVYSSLLKEYEPRHIGIYGCSAGGALTGQTASWLPGHGLPQPGAIGIFGAGAVRFMSGDSAYIAGYVDGTFPPPRARGAEKPGAKEPGDQQPDMTRGYFSGADMSDPVISPALHLDTVANFPPTLIITGTRAMDLSPAVYTNSRLIKAGVESTLIVGEGMGHCYIYQSDLPEARDAHQATVDFFRKNLK